MKSIIDNIKTIISESIEVKSSYINESNYHIYEYLHSKNDVDFTISILLKEKDGGIVYCPVQYGVNYINLDNLVNNVLIKSGLMTKDNSRWDSFFVPKQTNEEILLSDDIIINSFSKLFYENILPFFEKWNNLNVLYEFVKDKEDREELNDILGQFWQFKKATILRLCNDGNYQEYMDDFVERRKMIFEKRPDSIDVQRYYNTAKELKVVLDKTEPVYNV